MTNIQPTEAQKAKIEELHTAPYPVTLATAAKASPGVIQSTNWKNAGMPLSPNGT